MTKKNTLDSWRIVLFESINIVSFITFLILALLFVSCGGKKEGKGGSPSQDSQFQNYFPVKSSLRYAKGFSLTYKKSYKVLEISNPADKLNTTYTYVLYQRGTARPQGFENAQFIEIPIKSLACIYTTHVAVIDLLEANEVIKGFASPQYIINPEIKQLIKENKITYIGEPSDLNQETLISLSPQILMVAELGATDVNKYKNLMESEIAVVVNSEWKENTPLGRLEWIKLFAAFLNREQQANEKFDEIEKEYLRLKSLTKNISKRPQVLTGLTYKDSWYIPGGKSFMGNFIKDAGGTYPWEKDTTTASFPLDFEAVYEKSLNADFWINIETAFSKKDILSVDPRLSDLKPFKTNQIFNHNKRLNENGSSEFWETGLINPQIVLADLIKIFHPDLLPEHELYYYRRLQ